MTIGSSFKNIERLRYRIYSDNRKFRIEDGKITSNISKTIISTIISAFVTFVTGFMLAEKTVDSPFVDLLKEKIGWDALLFLGMLFIIIFFMALFFLIYFVPVGIKATRMFHIYYVKSDEPDSEIIKKYDNIACDSILIAWEYMEALEANLAVVKPGYLSKNYYFEALHYLCTAYKFTKMVINHNACLQKQGRDEGIEYFRFVNNLKMMSVLKNFLENNKNVVDVEYWVDINRIMKKIDVDTIQEDAENIHLGVFKGSNSFHNWKDIIKDCIERAVI